jgi:integrase
MNDFFQIDRNIALSKNICPESFKTKDVSAIMEDYRIFLHTKNLAYNTIEVYPKAIRYFLLDCGLDSWTLSDINRFIVQNVKDKNNYNFKFAMSLFLDYIGCFLLKPFLVKIKMPPRKKKFLSIPVDEVAKIINEMSNKRYKQVAKFQYISGARAIEAWTLVVEGIDYTSHKHILINPFYVKGQDSEQEYLIIPRKYEAWMKAIIGDKKYGFLFLDNINFQILYKSDKTTFFRKIKNIISSYDNQLRFAGRKHGIEKFSSHYFRHLYSTYIFEKTDNILSFMKMLRHKDIGTTLTYPIFKKTEKDDIIDTIE